MSPTPNAEDVRRQAMAYHRAGQFQSAADAWARAAQLDPAHPETRNNLGVALQAVGRLEDAARAFAEAARLRPVYADAWENLAGVLLALGRGDEAIAAARELVRNVPGSAASHIVLATALARAGRLDQAAKTCDDALGLEPDNADAAYCLANIRAAQQRWLDAAAMYATVIQRCPDVVDAHVNLGVCLAATGQLDAAAERFRDALKRDANCAPAVLRLADVLDRLGEEHQALAAAESAVRLGPNDPGALNLFASLSDRAQTSRDADVLYRRALEVDPNYAPALSNYATFLARRGEIERAIPMLRQAVEREPSEPVAHSSLCMYLNAAPGIDPREIFAEHVRWAERHARPLRDARPHEVDRTPGRRLRIGYVSPDWAGHPVARFMQPILESHDREAFEIHVYDDAPRPDAFTERLRPLAHAWHRVRGMPDAQLAEKIRDDRIDLLVDLAGHTAGNRLLVFARKPAPVQVSYLGYPNTTGLDAIDYRLTDGVADPPGAADNLHTEKLLRLPDTFLTFRPPVETPPVSASPLLTSGLVTFGSFNALWKINAPLLQLWAKVLAAVPGSRMLIKAAGLDDSSVSERIARIFEQSGIAPARLRMLGRERSYAGHLAAYSECDVCLDTFPYAGTTTTCEALWMGVPTISLVGQNHAARVGASVLTSIGLEELALNSADEFVDRAMELARDAARLAAMRREMRERLSRSPLMDAGSLTRAIERAFQGALGSN